jgi:autotransporter-associated beta strand protein
MRILPLFWSLCLLATSATLHAGSATWKLDPTSDDWNTAVNWTPETVPNDPADVSTFKSSNTTAISLSAQTDVDSVVFDTSASAFILSTATHDLTLFGTGVVNNSANAQNFVTGLQDGGIIQFRNTASASNAVFTVYGDAFQPYVFFHDNTTAGNATFINNGGFGGAVTWFFDSSTAGNATFYNFTRGDGFNDGVTVFEDGSTAGTARIFCEGGGTVFHKHSSAANSTLTVSDLGNITFLEHAGAGDATVIANGAPSSNADYGSILFLTGNATAGDATLVANGGMNGGKGGLIAFYDQTRGHKARVEVFGNGTLDISSHSALAPMTIGSLEGDGVVILGGNNLTVGRNHRNTIFSGVIKDGENGDTGGSITKVRDGTLALTHGSNYTGGTTVKGGNLLVDNAIGSGTGTGPVQIIGGALGGKGIIGGAVTVGTSQDRRGILEPGINAIGLLTIEKTLTFAPRGTYRWNIDVIGVKADEISSTGVTISNGALFSVMLHGNAALPIGTVFTVIDDTAALAISGTFSNLSDGSSFAAGNNTFQASYEGGDGNDLTLTVVP